ncbi:conserved hypothetical protein [delta proteobacterium NaphS2]|nr:conserved hypothetical protein [delta proteobacterium NaphS2]
METIIDKRHFVDLLQMDPSDVCRRSLCSYHMERCCYTLPVWNEDFEVCPETSEVICLTDDTEKVDPFLSLFIVHYLLTAKDIPITREWISVKDIPGGVGFFQGPHAIPTDLIEKQFVNRLDRFGHVCEKMGGMPLGMADKAYAFRIAPRIPVAVLLWEGDDEFPAESKLLFDRSISEHLALDIIFSLSVFVCKTFEDENAL